MFQPATIRPPPSSPHQRARLPAVQLQRGHHVAQVADHQRAALAQGEGGQRRGALVVAASALLCTAGFGKQQQASQACRPGPSSQ